MTETDRARHQPAVRSGRKDADSMRGSVKEAVDLVVRETAGCIKIAMPLGLGKPVRFINELYDRAVQDPDISLSIFTALSFAAPEGESRIERRVLKKLGPDLFGAYPSLRYLEDLRSDSVPENVTITAFFYEPGSVLKSQHAQAHYLCVNYTEVCATIETLGVNVIAMMVAPHPEDPKRFSLSSNTDISSDIFASETLLERCWMIGEVNANMPYFGGDAEVSSADFDRLIGGEGKNIELFGIPRRPVADQDYLIGLYTSTLIKDGGTLQIGIGSLGDAVAYALFLRHKHNRVYRRVLHTLKIEQRYGELIGDIGGLEPFSTGLYACTEMLTDPVLDLMEAGVIRRPVEDHGQKVVTHAAFFAGSRLFYKKLRERDDLRSMIAMKSVRFTNAVPTQDVIPDRKHARFCNAGLQVDLLGGVSSDTLSSGKVVSGVGGQFDFAVMTRQIPGSRSVIMVRSNKDGDSNIKWHPGHETLPRCLRDIVITEYGIADIKGSDNEETAHRLLAVADAESIDGVLEAARPSAGWLKPWLVPDELREKNTARFISQMLGAFKSQGFFPTFPFETGLSTGTTALLGALSGLNETNKSGLRRKAGFFLRSVFLPTDDRITQPALSTIGFDRPHGVREWFESRLIARALVESITGTQSRPLDGVHQN